MRSPLKVTNSKKITYVRRTKRKKEKTETITNTFQIKNDD